LFYVAGFKAGRSVTTALSFPEINLTSPAANRGFSQLVKAPLKFCFHVVNG